MTEREEERRCFAGYPCLLRATCCAMEDGGQTTEKVTVLLLLPPSGILFPPHYRAIRRCKILQVNDGGCDKRSSAALLACLMNAKATLLAPSLPPFPRSVQFSCSLGSRRPSVRRPPSSSLINRIFIISQHYNLLSIAVTSVFLLVEQIRIVPFDRSVGGGSGHALLVVFVLPAIFCHSRTCFPRPTRRRP